MVDKKLSTVCGMVRTSWSWNHGEVNEEQSGHLEMNSKGSDAQGEHLGVLGRNDLPPERGTTDSRRI